MAVTQHQMLDYDNTSCERAASQTYQMSKFDNIWRPANYTQLTSPTEARARVS